MTGLLVSVRNVAEAEAALRGGADIIDIKEPDHGTLGAASLDVIWEIYNFVAGRVPVSAACGELKDDPNFSPSSLPPLAFAKLGLARCGADPAWSQRLLAWWQELPPPSKGVAVVYADWKEAGAVSPDRVLEFCIEQRVAYLLFDTTNKSRSLMSYLDAEQVKDWQEFARNHGIQIVVAGSLRQAHLPTVLPLWSPAYVGVRGAVCEGDRRSPIASGRVAEWSQQLRAWNAGQRDTMRAAPDCENHSEAQEIS